MIIYRYDEDIFSSDADAIVNTVNCKGVMGKGLALKFKERYPEMYKEYKSLAKQGKITIGKLMLFKTKDGRIIINFPTKYHWRHKSKTEYIEKGLRYFVDNYKDWKIRSVAFPQLGCGEGGLKWEEVKPIMEKYLEDIDIKVEIFVDLKGNLIKKINEKLKNLDSFQLMQLDAEISKKFFRNFNPYDKNSLTDEIFYIMGKLRDKFNIQIKQGSVDDSIYSETETANFVGRFTQFAPSGGRLFPNKNLLKKNGIAVVRQDLKFQISIFPKNIKNVEPLRLEVDNRHKTEGKKIIHINPAGGKVIEIPSDVVEQISPKYCIDLVGISGSRYFREAIHKSLERWGMT